MKLITDYFKLNISWNGRITCLLVHRLINSSLVPWSPVFLLWFIIHGSVRVVKDGEGLEIPTCIT